MIDAHPPANPAGEVASKLTSGQREAVIDARYLDPRAYGVAGWEVSGRSANSLGLKGLAYLREIRGFTGRSRRGICLTDRGIAVRAHLLTQAQAQAPAQAPAPTCNESLQVADVDDPRGDTM